MENRQGLVHQDIAALAKYINLTNVPNELRNALADFHVLCFIQSTDTFTDEEFKQFCQIVINKESDISQIYNLNGWNTLQIVLKEAGKNIQFL